MTDCKHENVVTILDPFDREVLYCNDCGHSEPKEKDESDEPTPRTPPTA
jgi:hypothetical protein